MKPISHTPLLHFSLFKIKLKLCNGAQMSSPFLSSQISPPAQNSSKESFSCHSYNMYLRKHMHSVIKESVQWKIVSILATCYPWCYFHVFLWLNPKQKEFIGIYRCFALLSLQKPEVLMLCCRLEWDQWCADDLQSPNLVMFGSPSLFHFLHNNLHNRVWLHRCSGRSFYLCKFKGSCTRKCILVCTEALTEPFLLPQQQCNYLWRKSNVKSAKHPLWTGFLSKAFKQRIFSPVPEIPTHDQEGKLLYNTSNKPCLCFTLS